MNFVLSRAYPFRRRYSNVEKILQIKDSCDCRSISAGCAII